MNKSVKPADFKTVRENSTAVAPFGTPEPTISVRALEPRIAFDGAAVATAQDVADTPEPTPSAEAAAPSDGDASGGAGAEAEGVDAGAVGGLLSEDPAPQAPTIVFVDDAIEDLDQLLAGVPPEHEVVVIDGARSGMEQIAAYLDGRDGIASIHLVSHGDAGLLHLGSDALTADSLAAHAASLARIGAALAEDGDILIYGCDVGASADGARFVDTLARLTDADVAASDDDTGFAEAGGDWTLEARSGIVETDALSIDTYRGILSQQNSGAWTIGTNTASFTGGGAVVTVDFQAEGAEASFSAISNQTLNNIAAFSPAVQNTASLGFTFNWDATPDASTLPASGGTGLVTITFSQAVTNPILHLDRVGGFGGAISNSSLWTLLTSGATLTELAGTSHFDTTATTIVRTVNQALGGGATSESGTNAAVNTAAGSVQVNGTFTQIQFRLTASGVEGAGGDGIELKITYDVAPTATADTFTTVHDTPVSIDVRANDTDPTGDTLTITRVDDQPITAGGPGVAVTGGTVTLVGGSLVYTPNPDYAGSPTFTYTVSDANGGAATATVSGTVTNAAPVLDLNSGTTTQQLVTNGGFSSAADWTISSGWTISGGTASVSSDTGTHTLSTASLSGWNSGDAASGSAQVGLDLWWRNGSPAAGSKSTTLEVVIGGVTYARVTTDPSAGTTATVAYLNGASGNRTTFTEFTTAGWLIDLPADVAAAGALTFRFTGGSSGIADDFQIDNVSVLTRVDATAGSDFATTFTENGPPVAIADTDSDVRDKDDTHMVSAAVTLTNPQTGDRLLVGGSAAASGSIGAIAWTRTDTSVTFTGSATEAEYAALIRQVQFENTSETPSTTPRILQTTVNDGSTVSNTAVTTISIDRLPDPVNDAYSGSEDTAISGNVLANDDPGDTPVTSVAVTAGPTNGTLTSFNATTGDFVYMPNGNFAGTDTFTYTVTDADGDARTATVTLTVNAVNDAPVDGDEARSVVEDTTLTVPAGTGLLANLTDVDGGAPTVTGFTVAGRSGPFTLGAPYAMTGIGTLTIHADGSYAFAPAANYTGAIPVVTYTVSDGSGGSDSSTLTLTMIAVNDAPTDGDETNSVTEDTTLVVADGAAGDLLANSTDIDGGAPTITGYTIGTDPTVRPVGSPVAISGVGTIRINADGSYSFAPVANHAGPIPVITYTVSDGAGGTDTSTLTLTMVPVNDAPVAVADARTTAEDTPVTIAVRGNDTDVEGDALTVSSVTQPANGVVTIDAATGNPVYTPNANFTGTDSFTYTVRDPSGATSTATVTITVSPVNDAPDAADDSFTTGEDAPATIPVRGNDTDVDGDTLTITHVGGTAIAAGGPGVAVTGGTVTLVGGSLVFTPVPNYNGPTSFTYTISDGNGGTDTATVSGTVLAVNDPPVAVTDSFATAEDTPATIDVRGNDTDADGDTLTVTHVAGAPITAGGAGVGVTGGVVTLTAGGNLVFTPNPNYSGAPSFTYTVADGNGGTSTATVTGTVSPVNDAPVATNDTFTFVEDTPATIDVRANDADVDGDTLTVTHVDGLAIAEGGAGVAVTGGTVTLTGGSLVFTPAVNFNGTPSFTYRISDGQGGTATATVTGVGASVNDPPAAAGNTFTTLEDTPVVIDVLGNDSDPDGDTLAVTRVDGVAITAGGAGVAVTGGVVTLSATGTLTFTPNADYNGAPSFTYTISDGNGGTATATVSGTVTPVNDAPDARDDGFVTAEDTPVTIAVRGNDTDVDGDVLVVTHVDGAPISAGGPAVAVTGGSVTLVGGSLVFTPAANYNGAPLFTYTVSDGQGGSDTATVRGTVTAAQDPPVAANDAAATTENANLSVAATAGVLANDSDPDNDTLAVSQVAGAAGNVGQPVAGSAGGTFVVDPNGSWTFAPGTAFDGLAAGATATTSVQYQVTDGQGGTATATLTVTVTGTNDAPVVTSPIQDTTRTDGQAVSIATAAAFGDADTATLVYSASGLPAGLSIDPATGLVTGTLARDASVGGPSGNGTYVVTVTASDGLGGSVSDSFVLSVTNPAPVAATLADRTDADGTAGVTVATAALFSDPDGDTLAYAATGLPPGLAIDPATGLVTGTIARDASVTGPYIVTVTATDAQGATASTTFTWTVTNPPPSAADDSRTTGENQSVSVAAVGGLIGNDTDPDGDTLAVSAVGGVTTAVGAAVAGSGGGTFTLNADGSYGFDPGAAFDDLAAGDTRTTSVSYTLSDGQGGTATATLTITVTGANDVPSAIDDLGTTNENAILTVAAGLGLVDANDTDPDGDVLAITSVNGSALNVGAAVAGSAGGTFTVAADGGYVFDPGTDFDHLAPGATATTSITYRISDGHGGTDTATLTVTVTGTNDGPVAADDAGSTEENAVLAVATAAGVLGNDSDSDGGTLLVSAVEGGAGNVGRDVAGSGGGTFRLAADGSYTFDPGTDFDDLAPGASRTTAITYTVTDGQGGTDTASLTVTVIGRNDPVIAADDANSTAENTALSIASGAGVLGNDIDVDGGVLRVAEVNGAATGVGAGVTGTAGGTFTLNPDGSYTFDPGTAFDDLAAGQTRVTSVTYTVSDGQGGSDTATLTVTVTGVDDPMTALDSEVRGIEDTPYAFTVANFQVADPDGTLAEIRIETLPATGTLRFDGVAVEVGDVFTAAEIAAGRLTYSPAADEFGDDYATFEFSVGDTAGALAPLVQSRFNVAGDTEGWVHNQDAASTLEPVVHSTDAFAYDGNDRSSGTPTISPGNVTLSATNPGGSASPTGDGFIGSYDTGGSTGYFVAPAKFLGNLTSAYGKTFTYDFINMTGDGNPAATWNDRTDIEIRSGSNFIRLNTVDTTDGGTAAEAHRLFQWLTFGAALEAGSGWTYNDSVTAATEAQIRAVLSNVTEIRIGYEEIAGAAVNSSGSNAATSERYAIDNVVIQGAASRATMTINIDPVNDAPVAIADANAGTEHQVLAGDVTPGTPGQDSDVDGDTLTVTTVLAGATTVVPGAPVVGTGGGTFVVNADGSYTFTPGQAFDHLAAGEVATTAITYTIADGNGGTATATLEVTVTGQNDAPVAAPMLNASSDDATAATYAAGAYFTDADSSDTLSFSLSGLPAGFVIDANGVITGTWAADASQGGPASNGVYVVTVTANDGHGGVVAWSFNWTVHNPAPVAVDDDATTTEDANATGDVTPGTAGQDSDPDGDLLTVSAVNGFPASVGMAVAGSNGGTFTLAAHGGYTFAPGADFQSLAAGETRATSITYQISDGNGGTDLAVLVVTVTGVNDVPFATDPIPDRTSGDSQTIALDLGAIFSDAEGQDIDFAISGLPDGLAYDAETGVISGTIANNASTSGPGGNGVFTVTVLATDSGGATTTRVFDWSVLNTWPVADADAASVDEDDFVDIDVLANDSDGDGDEIRVYDGTDPFGGGPIAGLAAPVALNGAVSVNPDGTLRYVPNPDFSGTDLITYSIVDVDGGTATTTVLVTVDPVADAPVGTAIAAQADVDGDAVDLVVADRFTDADGETLSFSLVGTAGIGYPAGLSIDPASGRITGPLDTSASRGGPLGDGVYAVTVRATDPTGRTADVSFAWTVSNLAPVAEDDVRTTTEDAAVNGNAIDGVAPGTGTDTDGDGDTLAVTAQTNVAGSAGGRFTIGSDGSYTFDPGADFQDLGPGESRTTTLTYTVTDADGATDTAVIRVTVTGVNDAPTVTGALAARSSLDAETITPFLVAGVFADVEADTLTYSASNLPLGLAIDPATGRISGTIDNDASGPTGSQDYTVTVTALDQNGAATTTTFVWTVANPTLSARNDAFTTGENAPTSGDLFADNGSGVDIDPDGDAFTVATVTTGTAVYAAGDSVPGTGGGQFVVHPDGTFTFDPGTDFDHLAFGASTTTSVAYTIRDVNGAESTATVTVTVTGVNDGPVAVGTLPPQTSHDSDVVDVDVSGAFADPDGGTTFIYALIGTAGTDYPAGLSIDAAGHIVGTIDRNASQNGPYRVTVQASDGVGGVIAQSFTWVVENPAPDARDDSFTLAEGTALGSAQIRADNGLGADSDADGDTLTVTAVGGISANVGTGVPGSNGGTFTIAADGSTSFAPGAAFEDLGVGETRTTSVTYTLSDGNGGSDTATVTVTVTGLNDTPTSTAIGDQSSRDDETVSLDLSARFADVDGDTLAFALVGTAGVDYPAGLVVSAAGVVSGTIDSQASQGGNTGTPGVYSVTVRVDDGHGGLKSESFTWVVGNPAPDAVDDGATVGENAGATLLASLLGNDTDPDLRTVSNPDGDTLTVTAVGGTAFVGATTATGSAGGTFAIAADGSVSFDPAGAFEDLGPGETRSTRVTYTISDGNGGTDTATVEVTVTGANDDPTGAAIPPQAATDGATVSLALGPTFADADGDDLTFAATGLPQGLAIDAATGRITGTIDAGASGPSGRTVYTVSVTATDPHGGTVTTTFDYTVTNPVPTGTPLAGVTSDDGQTVGIALAAAFSDPDGDRLSYSATGLPPGLAVDPATGVVSGTLDADASVGGPYTVTVTADDGNGGAASRTFLWTVRNPAPLAHLDLLATDEETTISGSVLAANGVAADADPDGDTLVVAEVGGRAASVGTAVEGSAGGTFSIAADGTFMFAPGDDFQDLAVGESRVTTATYTIDDGQGGRATATVRVTVQGVNDSPTATSLADVARRDGDSVMLATAQAFGDPDGDPLTYAASRLPPGLAIDPATGIVSGTIDPSASAGGPYTVTVSASDGNGGTATRTFQFTVTNPPPAAADDAATTTENAAVAGNVRADNGAGIDRDPDGDALAVSAVGGLPGRVGEPVPGSAGGTFTIAADGSYSFEPGTAFDDLQAGETRSTSITYTLRDADGATSSATVTIAVTGVNDPPVIAAVTPPLSVDSQTIAFDVSAFVRDPERDGLSYAATGLPPGLAIEPGTGRITGTLARDASQGGPYAVTLTVDDGNGGVVTTTFVWPVDNVPPVAVADVATTREDEAVVIPPLANDRDPDGDPLTVVAASAVNGTVTIRSDGSIGYTPDPSFAGTDVVTYVIDDGNGGRATATVTVLVTPRQIVLAGETFGFEGPRITVAPVDTTPSAITADGIVVDTVFAFGGLSSIAGSLSENGIVLAAANGLRSLGGIGVFTDNTHAVITEVLHVTRIEELSRSPAFERPGDSFTIEGLTGFSLRSEIRGPLTGSGDRGQLVIESLVRDRVLMLQVSNTLPHSRIVAYRMTTVDGRPLPAWLERATDDLVIGERPADVETLNLHIEGIFEDGTRAVQDVTIQAVTGEIQPLNGPRQGNIGAPLLFQDQLRAPPMLSPAEVDRLGAAIAR